MPSASQTPIAAPATSGWHPHAAAPVVFRSDSACGRLLGRMAAAEFVELTLAPGGDIPPHALDLAVTFYVVAGEGVATVDGQAYPVRAGDLLSSPAAVPRAWRNPSSTPLKVLVVKHG